MDIFTVIQLLGGLGLFLYGMLIMGKSLEKVAGAKLHGIIEIFTGNQVKGVLAGMGVTAIIQSSSATTVMVVGFVNAGIMTLKQAVGVIMGANIGTTVTAQILRLSSIGTDNFFLRLLNPRTLAPLGIAIAIVMLLASQNKKRRDLGEVLMGLGILFMGMFAMEGAMSGLRELPQFKAVFAALSNPVLGVLAGAVITAIIQSSSASIGILQAASSTGMIPYSAAIPVILGQNIGTCVTALLSGIGANKNAKKAATIHLYFNIIGTVVFLTGIYLIAGTVGFDFWDDIVDTGGIANFHTLFNVANTLLLLPFSNSLVKIANLTIKDSEEKSEIQSRLDPRFLAAPSVALEQCRTTICKMGYIAESSIAFGRDAILEGRVDLFSKMEENEQEIDKMEFLVSQYLLRITERDLNPGESALGNVFLHSVTDFERIGDHAENLGETANEMARRGVIFSDAAKEELHSIFSAVGEIVSLTITALEQDDVEIAKKIEPLEEVIDIFKENLKTNHINRLTEGKCTLDSGIFFVETVTNLERIADHCSNVGLYILQLSSGDQHFDLHEYAREMHSSEPNGYKESFKFYKEKYFGSTNGRD